MGDIAIEVVFPMPVAVMGFVLGACVLYIIYSIIKFFVSLWTGA